MSMISAQIDELRRMADGQATYRDMREVMLKAADTIGELRDDLQRANAENAKLREQGKRLFDKALELGTENAKLRVLVWHMNTCIEHYEPDGSIGCEHCPLDNDTGNCDYERRMRELGVEVDG